MKNLVVFFLLVKMTKSIATSLLDFFIRLVKAAFFLIKILLMMKKKSMENESINN